MKINKGTKVGLIIQIIAFAIMILLMQFNKAIPSVVFWIFSLGIVISFAGTLGALHKKKDKI